MHRKIAGVLLAAFVMPAVAVTLTVVDSSTNSTTSYTLNSLSVSSTGDVSASVASSSTNPIPTPTYYTLTAAASPSAGGTVLYNGSTLTSISVVSGTTVTLSYTASSGYTFAGWSEASCGTASTCSFTMSAAKSVTASFTSTSTGGGTACPSTTSSYSVLCTTFPTETFNQTTYSPAPESARVFRIGPFTTANLNSIYYIDAWKTSAATTGKWLIVSESFGDFSPAQSRCTAVGVEASRVSLKVTTATSDRSYCAVNPGKYYYVHVVNGDVNGSPSLSSPNCTTTTNCSFYFRMR